jgi:hypothetical protein
MKNRLLLFTIFLQLSFHFSSAQSINTNWKQDLEAALAQFMSCSGGTTNSVECNTFSGKALNTVYKVNDFYLQKAGRYMTVNEILKFLKETNQWSSLGKSYDQKALETAQEYANSKKAVIAVYENSAGIGHVVVITPGELQSSGSWGLKVPNAASFFSVEPAKSFSNKAMSFAFSKNMIKDIVLYARNY